MTDKEESQLKPLVHVLVSGVVAIAALARLDELTMIRDWHKSAKLRRQVRLIINTAKNDMAQPSR